MPTERYELYGGEVVLLFNPGNHTYHAEVDGKKHKCVSVTAITGILNKPALVYWAANEGAKAAEEILVPGLKIDEINRAEIIQAIKSAHRVKRDTTADIGTQVHTWIEEYVDSTFGLADMPAPPINENIRNSVDQFLEWETNNEVEWLVSERKVYSRKYKYAGTLDSEARVNGKLSVVDIKTGSGIYPEMFMQVAGYAKAREEETGEKYAQLCILRIPRDGESFEAQTDTRITKHHRGFLGCHRVLLWQKEISL